MKLHLGCGKRLWPGFVNVDLFGEPDVRSDLKALPFGDESADEIHAIHVWEHFHIHECEAVMREWMRVLKPGGKLVLEMPCKDKVFALIRAGEERPQLVMWPFFSNPAAVKSEYDLHKWLWGLQDIAQFLAHMGFVDIKSAKPLFHQPIRDMRIIGVKGGDHQLRRTENGGR